MKVHEHNWSEENSEHRIVTVPGHVDIYHYQLCDCGAISSYWERVESE